MLYSSAGPKICKLNLYKYSRNLTTELWVTVKNKPVDQSQAIDLLLDPTGFETEWQELLTIIDTVLKVASVFLALEICCHWHVCHNLFFPISQCSLLQANIVLGISGKRNLYVEGQLKVKTMFKYYWNIFWWLKCRTQMSGLVNL